MTPSRIDLIVRPYSGINWWDLGAAAGGERTRWRSQSVSNSSLSKPQGLIGAAADKKILYFGVFRQKFYANCRDKVEMLLHIALSDIIKLTD